MSRIAASSYRLRRLPATPTRGAWWLPSGSLAGLVTQQQLEREAARQDLLDQRWRRWRSMILTATATAAVLTGAIPLENVLHALVRAIGVP